MKTYNVTFYVINNNGELCEAYNTEMTNHEVGELDGIICPDSPTKYLHIDGIIIDVSQFAVIEYEELDEE